MNIKNIDKTYVANTYARFPLTLVRGSGSLVYDDSEREYIDLGTGIAVNAFGVCDKEWTAAVEAQLSKIQHTSNLYYSEPCALLAEQLCIRTGMKKVFFSNSGAEANECAIKAAREYGERTKGSGYSTIVTLRNSFHGRTLTTLAATGQDVFHERFTPLTPGFVYADANDIDDVKRLVAQNKCCAVMFEVVQGEGGVIALERDFIDGLAELARSEDLLLIADEVQIGNGRSGMLYGYMNYGIKPDIFTTAKGIGGGLPIGVTVLGERVADIFEPGMNGSTFGGNPVCCAGALNILSRIDEALLCEVREKSRYIRETLSRSKGIKSVSGLGLMLGVECFRPADEVIAECRENGVLVIKAKQKVRLLPALNIPWEQLEKAIKILVEVAEK
ncbi:MAG: aminotransferase class III-fold pyridoxal phosphate-dependent enzyme [Eubacteriales bacterium]|nr:aminotransferase class III-fold pyridoxal phosphate-dependent enzyme [Eubacteriales bacterium]